ncbi:MAG: hypothetical protein AAFN77_10900 [Planctomycetota bacterium]
MNSRNLSLKQLSPRIHALLQSIRKRIRGSVLVEGAGWVLFWVAALFWISLVLDYAPVRFGYSELPVWARISWLIVTAVVVCYLMYRLVLRRIFVPLKDDSLALLIERRYEQFSDALVTTVNRCSVTPAERQEVPVDLAMLERTRIAAEALIDDVDPAQIISRRPSRTALIASVVAIASIIALTIASPSTMELASRRLYLLSEQLWPRQCEIELIGVVVKRESSVPGISEMEQTVVPRDGKLYIARGSSVSMIVKAKQGLLGQDDSRSKLPETCWLNFFRPNEGTRGSQPFKRIGSPKDGNQTYLLDGAPLENVILGLTFEVAGGDDRIGPFEIVVVDEPVVRSTDMALKYPEYIVDEESLRFTDRIKRWTGEARLPIGTKVSLQAKSESQLKKVYVRVDEGSLGEEELSGEPLDKPFEVLSVDGDRFEYALPALMQPTLVRFYLCDANDIVSEQPHEILLEPVKDEPPRIETRLHGIGTAVTPDVTLPITASVEDDYGIDRVWIELENGVNRLMEDQLELDQGKLDVAIDFRERRTESGEAYRLVAEGESQLSLVVAAQDFYNLDEKPNFGTGDRYELDIVSPDELLRILERLEVGQRRRLEQVYTELRDLKKYLRRTQPRDPIDGEFIEPGDAEPGDVELQENANEESLQQEREMKRLFAQRALLQIDKSKQEILGSANAFDDLRLQVINNRIVGTNREQRFETQVIAPLTTLADSTLTRLNDVTRVLEQQLEQLEAGRLLDQTTGQTQQLNASSRIQLEQIANQSSVDAIELADQAIDELNQVLSLLLKFETQNELLDIVRQMIAEQKAILERTREQRQKKAFEGLLD